MQEQRDKPRLNTIFTTQPTSPDFYLLRLLVVWCVVFSFSLANSFSHVEQFWTNSAQNFNSNSKRSIIRRLYFFFVVQFNEFVFFSYFNPDLTGIVLFLKIIC